MEFNSGMITKIFILSMLATLKITESSNILAVFPSPSFSHQLPLLNLARQLAKRGHNVVTITANPGVYEPIENYHEIDFSIMYKIWLKLQEEQNFSLQKKLSAFEMMVPISAWSGQFMDALYKMEPVQRLLRSNETSFDLLLYEGLYPSALGFKYHFNNIPSVVMITIPLYNSIQYSMGNPINPSYMTSFLSDYSDKMTFLQRVRNTVLVFFEIYVHQYHYYYHSDLIMKKYFGENAPSVQELERSNNLFLLSGDLSQSYPTPFQPNTIPVGTLHVDDKVKPLPADLQKFMDEAEDGVIYFSLGSNMKGVNVPVDIRNSFAKAFAKFPKIRVLWKWESDVEFPGKPSNVLLRKWLPQHSILAHPNLRLFITQGGQQSRQEVIHYAVPTLTVPLFWDQPWNGKKLEAEGAGLVLEFYDVTYETLYEKLKLLLTDSSFKENMIRLSNISKDKPIENKDLAAWWVEYVIRHKGAPHLRPAVQDLKWYQYTLLDVAAFLLSVIFITLYIIYFIIKRILTKFLNGKQKKLKST